jgi:hypothetical protein
MSTTAAARDGVFCGALERAGRAVGAKIIENKRVVVRILLIERSPKVASAPSDLPGAT